MAFEKPRQRKIAGVNPSNFSYIGVGRVDGSCGAVDYPPTGSADSIFEIRPST